MNDTVPPFAFLHRYPFLRLLGPLIGGILCGDYLFSRETHISWLLFLATLLLLFLFLFASYFSKRFSARWIFGIFVSIFFFVAGLGLMNLRSQNTLITFSDSESVLRVTLTEKPDEKERSLLCRVRTEEDKNLLLYLAKDSAGQLLKSGDELLVFTRLSAAVNNGNPDEFDYARYLLHKEVSGTGFVAQGNWKRLASLPNPSLRQTALTYRERILSLYRTLGFDGEAFAVLSALTVGYKEELSEDIRETYSISGASHVLALSGLHIGFLYAMLLFCLKALPGRFRGTPLLRTVLIIAVLWGFAFFTGLSPSVVRSVIMFSLFACGELFSQKGIPINTLSVAAVAMLLYNPGWLFDVGFQLSFCAVAAIMLMYPWLYRQLPVSNCLLKWGWRLLCVSLVAQVGAAPLVLIYFSRFSTYFLLTNVLVIPLVSLIMYAAVVMLLATPIPVVQGFIAQGVKMLIGLLNDSVRWVEHLPHSSVDGIWTDCWEVLLFYLSVLLLMACVASCRIKRVWALGVCLLVAVSYHCLRVVNDRPVPSIVFYNVRGCPAIHCIQADGRSWLTYADSLPDEKRLYRAVSASWFHQRLEPPMTVQTDYASEDFCVVNHICTFGKRRVGIVNDDRWKNKTASQPLFIHYLYLCKGYTGRLEDLTQLFTIGRVVLDSSLPDYRKKKFSAECRQLGIHFISLSDEGSARFLL